MNNHGTFLGIPYNWQWPGWKKIWQNMWNKNDHRLFPPKVFGWGYSINFYELIFRRQKLALGVFIILLIASGLFIKKVHDLDVAHSTFENYYEFRGCSQLLQKTDDYGICRTSSGQTIKIVKFQNKWYLDGDLPCGFLCW